MSGYTEKERKAFKAGAGWMVAGMLFLWIAFEIFFGCTLSKCKPRPVEYYTPGDLTQEH